MSLFTTWTIVAQINVLTYHNDLARTGLNTNETLLTPANVNTNTFGQLFSYVTDGQVYTQPLYVSGVIIPGQGTHNVVFVATQHNSVYAFDADSNEGPNGGLLWQTNLGPSAATPSPDFGTRYGPFHDVTPEVGITSTPVIDLATGTIFVDALTHEGTSYIHRLHALNITNGAEQPYSPVVVSATFPGQGVSGTNGIITFNAKQQIQRCALTLADGVVYLAFAGYGDTDPYHGWIIGYRASDLQPMPDRVFNTTPNSTIEDFGTNAGEGGIWMSGNGLAVDAQNNIYLIVGNGIFNANTNGAEYGDCVLKLSSTNQMIVMDYFAPFNQDWLADNDVDLGSGGALLLPDEVGSAQHPHLLVGCGKEGRLYLLDRDDLGNYNEANDDQVVQSLPGLLGGTWSSVAYFNHEIYVQPASDGLKAFAFTNGLLYPYAVSRSQGNIGFPGATPSISANGTNNGIVWVVQVDQYYLGQPAILHAFAATNLANELYNSSQAGTRDTLGPAVKFAVPTVANGKVYVGSSHQLAVFAVTSFLTQPVIAPSGGLFTNSVTITITNPGPGAGIYYTLDGSTPTSSSAAYTGPFTLTNSAMASARAIQTGDVSSGIAEATFLNVGSPSMATNVLRQDFYSGETREELEAQPFPEMPGYIQYLTSFESSTNPVNDYAERVSGYFIPNKTGNYVFFVCSDDDSDLFLSTDATPGNKHLIATETSWSDNRQWTASDGGSSVSSKRSDQFSATTWPGGHTITLTNGGHYYIEGVHHQGGGGTDFSATFKLSTEPDPQNGIPSRLTGNLIAADAFDNTAVKITSPPTDAFGAAGGWVRVAVGATSSYVSPVPSAAAPPLFYQWQAAPPGSDVFTNIPGAASNPSSIGPLVLSQNGALFRAVVNAGGSSATSPPAILHVGLAPAITNKLASVSRGTGSSVVFAVNATGTPPLSFQWMKNQASLINDARIAGAQTSSLTISNLQFSDAGSFAVVVTNLFGKATSQPPAALTILDRSGPMLAILNHTNLEDLATNRIILAGTASDAGFGNNGVTAVRVNGATANSGTAKGAGVVNWSRTLTLVNGTNTITVIATDSMGNSTTEVIRLISDISHPTISISSPVANQRWSNSVFTVKGTARDNQQTAAIWCQCNGLSVPVSTSNSWANWTASVTLTPGTNVVKAWAEDWIGNRSTTNTVSVVFVVASPLTLQMTGQGVFTPNYSNAMLEIGRSYTITPTPARGYVFSNWVQQIAAAAPSETASPKLTFMMQTNLMLQANFITNPFIALAGNYQGLFYDTNGVTLKNTGFINLTLNSNGVFSAKLQQPSGTYSLGGQFSIAGGWSTNTTTSGGKTAAMLQLDLASGDFIGGVLSNASGTAGVWANRAGYSVANPTMLAGRYSLVLSNLSTPANSGSGAITVSTNGNLSFAGTLSDGTRLTQSTFLSSQNDWPLYLSLYNGSGMLMGWVTLTNGPGDDVEGALSWIRLTVRAPTLTHAGLTNELELHGSKQ